MGNPNVSWSVKASCAAIPSASLSLARSISWSSIRVPCSSVRPKLYSSEESHILIG